MAGKKANSEAEQELSLEASLTKLEQVMEELGSSELSLEESFAKYKEGMDLLLKCTTVFKHLLQFRYCFVLGRKNIKKEIMLGFDETDFHNYQFLQAPYIPFYVPVFPFPHALFVT